MNFDDDRVDLSDLQDRRGQRGLSFGRSMGGRGGGALPRVGGIGLLVAVVLAVLTQCLGGAGDSPLDGGNGLSKAQTPQQMAQRCSGDGAITRYDDCYVLKSMNEVNEIWAGNLPRQVGVAYRKPTLVYFDDAVRTACGSARASAGPFYCPADETVYIDLRYMSALFERLGVSGRYAQTYVVAHEVGHHLQTVLGTEARVTSLRQRRPDLQQQLSVRTELQADCYAGVYGSLADRQGNQVISEAEYRQALDAASAVGDDAIMASAGHEVDPDTFTHGSAADRQRWFRTGFDSGSIAACATFDD